MKHIKIYEDFEDDIQKEDEPWYEPEDCEYCLEDCEHNNIEYEHNFTWRDGCWYCDSCGQPQ